MTSYFLKAENTIGKDRLCLATFFVRSMENIEISEVLNSWEEQLFTQNGNALILHAKKSNSVAKMKNRAKISLLLDKFKRKYNKQETKQIK